MIVAVTMRLAEAKGYAEQRDAISHDLIVYLDRMGVTPVLVPNTLQNPEEYLGDIGARALLLTGGDDIGPRATESDGAATTQRDLTEARLLAEAVSHALPVLGLCRGLQLINLHFGGGLKRDLLGAIGEKHVSCTHLIRFADGGREERVNSYHNQGVLLSDLADPLRLLAKSPGGVVEALEHKGKNIRAVMWHPERNNPALALDEEVFSKWLGRDV